MRRRESRRRGGSIGCGREEDIPPAGGGWRQKFRDRDASMVDTREDFRASGRQKRPSGRALATPHAAGTLWSRNGQRHDSDAKLGWPRLRYEES